MSVLSPILQWLKKTFSPPISHRQEVLPPIFFPYINVVTAPPKNSEVKVGEFYLVAPKKKPKWALFQCPCGCNSVITLSLQKAHHPHWSVVKSSENRPTLSPSVWRDIGCLSHYWIKDGRVYWCEDTGSYPYLDNENSWCT